MANDNNRQVFRFFRILTCALFLLLATRITYVIFFTKEDIKIYKDPKISSEVVRGEIVDRNQNLLAIQTEQYALSIDIDKISNVENLSVKLSPYLFISSDEIERTIRESQKKTIVIDGISRQVASSLSSLIERDNLEDVLSLFHYSGRSYPAGYHLSTLIGNVDIGNHGISGIEKEYDEILLPYPELDKKITYGSNLTLTLDLPIQYMLDSQINRLKDVSEIKNLKGVILDARNGNVIACSSYPFDTRLEATYEPGMIIELLSAALALEKGHEDYIGRLESLESLSNEEIYSFFTSLFSYSDNTSIPDETESWSKEDRKQILSGHKFTSDALSIASALSSLSDGNVKKPIVVKQIYNSNDRTIEERKDESKAIFSAETIATIKGYLKNRAISDPYFSSLEDVDVLSASIFSSERSSTFAFVPEDEPKYLIYITKSEEDDSSLNGDTALLTQQIIKGLLSQGKLDAKNQKRLEI